MRDVVGVPATWHVIAMHGCELLKIIKLLNILHIAKKDLSIRQLNLSPELQLGLGGRPEESASKKQNNIVSIEDSELQLS